MSFAFPRAVTQDPQKTPVLIVDDDDAVRKLLERIAIRAGFEAHGARDGQQAMELLSQRRFEIVIVDLMMPRVSGYDLVQKISAMPHRPIVIVATAMANGDVARLDDSMVRRVIRKPFDINAVSNTLMDIAAEFHTRQAAPSPAVDPPVVPSAEDAAAAPPPPIDEPS